mmetsp:Transcript_15742/g.23390  ORF Transcript_15742/g.23390 Transcript_15742/m.23390 type:complete len:114 (-) Transcript_15742:260-601(-)
MFRAFKIWKHLAHHAQFVSLSQVRSVIYHNRIQKILDLWERCCDKEQNKQLTLNSKGEIFYKHLVFRRTFDRWSVGLRVLQQEQLIEERVAAKWRDVNKWLEDKEKHKQRWNV